VRSTGQLMTDEEADDLPAEQLAAVKDHLVRVKRFPAIWIDRLDKAIGPGLARNYPADGSCGSS
jgi:hypothetical protein